MIRIEQSQQFKRDIKAYQHKRKTLAKLIEVLRMIEREEKLPARLRAHKLHGRYANHWECHVESDSLLIWIYYTDEGECAAELIRFGSHSELFG